MKNYKVLKSNSKKPFFISCEHASGKIPKRYGYLGLDKKALEALPHYCDMGVEKVTRLLSKEFSAKSILTNYSRLIVDVNQPTNSPYVIKLSSFGSPIPGNLISKKEKEYRFKKYYYPYHKKVKKEVDNLLKVNDEINYICIHSFTHFVNGEERKLDMGVLYKYAKDKKFCDIVKRYLDKNTNFKVKINEPYSAKVNAGFTMNLNGKNKKVRCIEFEINDKHLKTKNSINKMARILIRGLKKAMECR